MVNVSRSASPFASEVHPLASSNTTSWVTWSRPATGSYTW
uniref:Uncharacterized protein n=1 Tax=Arundo donax TaxID=35708 RepID=A0A0A8YLJ6_ARUDO